MQNTNLKSLHDRDLNLWIEQTIHALKNKDINNMDWENLIEELEDMGRSEKRALESYLQRLIEHILKLSYWQAEYSRNYKHWQAEVINFRKLIARILKRNPSLKNHLTEIYPEIFNDVTEARKLEYNLPDKISISLKTIMESDYCGEKNQ